MSREIDEQVSKLIEEAIVLEDRLIEIDTELKLLKLQKQSECPHSSEYIKKRKDSSKEDTWHYWCSNCKASFKQGDLK